ncbi:hypothetical protein T265_08828 [Opisthorchis viverrini]|uniref:Apoptosis-antagonizing transcription factor C-terminal domain-containing protein n=1 Tax=Opisthorchis viverrini TaxID=6198 RepID=A0A074Z7U0_OPIVI|nr:hypothetical protein T265_08828 [Opisthorchis viverrini]KER23256.1 hypothetical protein T265_08828 [Opisthorchis viverrini]
MLLRWLRRKEYDGTETALRMLQKPYTIDCDDIQIEKPKRVVDVRASKGRVLRYLRLPKAVDFMSPDTTEYFSQTQRNNLFAQLKANKD